MGKHNDRLLKQLPLFAGIDSSSDLDWVLNCVDGKETWYSTGEIIQEQGEPVHFAGVVLSGIVQTFQRDEAGELTVLETLGDGDLYGLYPPKGETGDGEIPQKSPVGVRAATECQILPLRWLRLMHLCNFNCEFHRKLIGNMNQIIKERQ